MKYSNEEAVTEILKRSNERLQKRYRQVSIALSATVCAMFAVLVTAVAALSGAAPAGASQSVYGSFMLSRQAGGYVLVAVIAFSCGLALAILLLYRKHHNNQKENGGKENE